MPYGTTSDNGLGFSLKPPRWLRNIVKGAQSAEAAVERIQEKGLPHLNVDVTPKEPIKIAWLPLAIGLGAAALLFGGGMLGRKRGRH